MCQLVKSLGTLGRQMVNADCSELCTITPKINNKEEEVKSQGNDILTLTPLETIFRIVCIQA